MKGGCEGRWHGLAANEKKQADELLKEGYAQYYTSIYRYALSRLGDSHASEDVAQEAFVIYYKRLRSGEVFTAPRAFLYRTADHLVQKQFERNKKAQNCTTLEEVIEIPAQNADPDERLTFEEYSRQISAALSDKDAALFSMRYIEDLKIEDIAARLDMSIPAVTTRLHRLRKKLREIVSTLF